MDKVANLPDPQQEGGETKKKGKKAKVEVDEDEDDLW